MRRKKIGKQIDYILVSTRWKSCVVNCSTRWQPSIHRDIHGEKNDHALVQCTWKRRIRVVKPKLRRDLDCLSKQAKVMKAFEAAVEEKLIELRFSASTDSTCPFCGRFCPCRCSGIELRLQNLSGRRRAGAHGGWIAMQRRSSADRPEQQLGWLRKHEVRHGR